MEIICRHCFVLTLKFLPLVDVNRSDQGENQYFDSSRTFESQIFFLLYFSLKIKLEVTRVERADLLPGTFILEVKAIDGDRGVNYDNITYSIVRQGPVYQEYYTNYRSENASVKIVKNFWEVNLPPKVFKLAD